MRSRASSLLLGAGMAALAAVVGTIAIVDLTETGRGLADGAATIMLHTGAAAGLVAAVALMLIAAMLLPSRPSPRLARALFGGVVACLPLLVLLPLAVAVAGRAVLENRGYRLCADARSAGQQRLTSRWCRHPAGAERQFSD